MRYYTHQYTRAGGRRGRAIVLQRMQASENSRLSLVQQKPAVVTRGAAVRVTVLSRVTGYVRRSGATVGLYVRILNITYT